MFGGGGSVGHGPASCQHAQCRSGQCEYVVTTCENTATTCRSVRESFKTPHHADCSVLTTLTRRFVGGFAASAPAAPPAEPASPPGLAAGTLAASRKKTLAACFPHDLMFWRIRRLDSASPHILRIGILVDGTLSMHLRVFAIGSLSRAHTFPSSRRQLLGHRGYKTMLQQEQPGCLTPI